MPNTFFPLSVLKETRAPDQLLAKCGWCKLCQNPDLRSPKMRPTGMGRRDVLIIGEAPGRSEDERNRQFVGKTGRFLRERLQGLGINPDRDCTFDNALRCRPPNNKIPNPEMVEWCRPNVLQTIKDVKPKVIILFGKHAVKSVIGYLWRENVGDVSRWVGWKIPVQKWNCWVCPTYHPSFVMRQESKVLDKLFVGHLANALIEEERPWKKVPDYKSQVEVCFDVSKAVRTLDKLATGTRPVAFDFETNMLKPDHEASTIVCCSASDGKQTIAYPWVRETREATKKLICSRVPKIASNIKFEERWSQAKLGCGINNWDRSLDTMLCSHVLDNREEINSIKFQAFVRLGQESYDDHIKPYLQTRTGGGYAINRIKEVDLTDLLLYCGLDSLLEWRVAKLQKEELDDG